MSREENVAVFEDTKRLYETNDRLKDSINKSVSGQIVIPESEKLAKPVKRFDDTLVRVSKKRSVEAAMEYRGKKVCVHNFASATNPGGGVTKGSSAQEECLCRVSTLYPCLNQQELWESFYKPHRSAHNPVYNADIIYTPNVTVFKTDTISPELLPKEEWMDMDVVTCAAPNLREHPSNAMNPHAGSTPVKLSDKELMDIHMTRARRILDSAAAHQCDVVILGAFGCGAFCNEPRIVAEAYRRVIVDYDGVFEVIEFAVYCAPGDSRNFDAFDREMNRL